MNIYLLVYLSFYQSSLYSILYHRIFERTETVFLLLSQGGDLLRIFSCSENSTYFRLIYSGDASNSIPLECILFSLLWYNAAAKTISRSSFLHFQLWWSQIHEIALHIKISLTSCLIDYDNTIEDIAVLLEVSFDVI